MIIIDTMINSQLTDQFNYHQDILSLMLTFESLESTLYMSIVRYNNKEFDMIGGFLF
jgi:hypothetical protein